jgi:hypothetical protein
MEIVIVILLVGAVIWLAFKLRGRFYASTEARLVDAWRVVLSDPSYEQRRPLEERKHAAVGDAQTLAEAARKSSRSAA